MTAIKIIGWKSIAIKIATYSWIFLLLFFLIPKVSAEGDYINIVNPVRVSRYNQNLYLGVQAEYDVILSYKLPATWLLTYDVLNDATSINIIKGFDKKQELGLFMEVSPDLAKKANVVFHQTGSWHFASTVFLSGYTQEERISLIDTVFAQFKERFGHYPISVGAWWLDSFSLKYMHDKYGVVANLTCADQFSTDNYQIWGTYWSTPYYPSTLHSGLPAKSLENKIGVVTIQWASRHPRLGYYSSLYSVQDYLTTRERYDSEFFKNLLRQYAYKKDNLFGQITVGLEADLPPETYSREYQKQIQIVSSESATKLTMGEFANWYKSKFLNVSPEHRIDFDGMAWYQSPYYRLGIDAANKKIVDFRVYPQDFREPYFLWPNRERDLRINIPALVDSIQDPSEVWGLTDLNIKTTLRYFESSNKPPIRLFKSDLIKIKKINGKWRIETDLKIDRFRDGVVQKQWSLETKHLLKAPRDLMRTILSLNWKRITREDYWISPEELIGLDKLKQFPSGKVLVYDHECLQCEYFGKYKPSVFGNYRDYVGKYSQKSIVYDKAIIDSREQNGMKDKLRALNVDYLYLTKYDVTDEYLKLSPGDYGIEKVFENAAVQIWKVVK